MNLSALQAAIKLIADAVNDVLAITPGQNVINELFTFENLFPDLLALLPQIGVIPIEVKAMAPHDYLTLVQNLVTELKITDAKANAIIAASLKVLSDLVVVVLPDVEVLVAAVK